MLKPYTLLAFTLLCRASLISQDVTVTFSATLNGVPTPLDSIWVQNTTAGGDTMLYSPDNVLVLDLYTGLDGALPAMDVGLSMSEAVPNPFDGSTRFQVSMEDAGELILTVHDALGKVLAYTRQLVGQGVHAFSYAGGPQGVLFVEARWHGQRAVQRLLNMNGGQQADLRYAGLNDQTQNGGRPKGGGGWFEWQFGDSLFYIVYATSPFGYILSAADGEIPDGPSTPLFELLPGIVCAQEPVVADIDGNIYPVVQTGSQCWMAADLKTTRYRDGTDIPNVTAASEWSSLNT